MANDAIAEAGNRRKEGGRGWRPAVALNIPDSCFVGICFPTGLPKLLPIDYLEPGVHIIGSFGNPPSRR